MPIYDCRCLKCGAVERDVQHRSDDPVPACQCGGSREHIWLNEKPKVVIFREGWYENLSLEPMYFSSKAQLRAELKERNLSMDYCE